MKREILCDSCASRTRRTLIEAAQVRYAREGPEGEHRWVSGVLACNVTCDGCNRGLDAGEHANALSIHNGDYYEWERDYFGKKAASRWRD